jgi:hypothetical protein
LVLVAVITRLFAALNIAVTTTRHDAVTHAAVGIIIVAVVTCLKAFLARLDIVTSLAIAAARLGAIIPAGIGVVVVAIITFFARADMLITAARLGAGISAVVAVVPIAVIASFIAGLTLSNVLARHAIAAASHRAIV